MNMTREAIIKPAIQNLLMEINDILDVLATRAEQGGDANIPVANTKRNASNRKKKNYRKGHLKIVKEFTFDKSFAGYEDRPNTFVASGDILMTDPVFDMHGFNQLSLNSSDLGGNPDSDLSDPNNILDNELDKEFQWADNFGKKNTEIYKELPMIPLGMKIF